MQTLFLGTFLLFCMLANAHAQESAYDKVNGQRTSSSSAPATSGSEVPLPSGVALPGNAGTTNPAKTGAATGTHEIPEIQIGVGDMVDISVFNVPDLASKARVSSQGNLDIPLVGTVHVAGLTTAQAQEAIAAKLKDGGFVNEPQVTVMITEYASQGISVLGEVQKPGVYPVLAPRRLWDVISMAGGLSQRAGKSVTIAHRNDPDKPEVITLTTDPADLESNVPVYPGDTIAISRAGIVYVVGDVQHPSGFIMDNNDSMTVLQALAMAQGATGTASLSKALLIRQSTKGRQEQPVNLKMMLQAKAPDIPMQAEDILFVPNSLGKSAGKKALEAIVQTAVGVTVYRP